MVSYIPETLKVTTHRNKHVGDKINLLVERVLAQMADAGLLT
jgi:riboflavin synthase alpha subunit